jgi:hypothetical protein
MKIVDLHNNCGPVAFQQLLPDVSEADILQACFTAGYEEDMGMFPHHLHQASKLLGLQLDQINIRSVKPSHDENDMRKGLTLHQALLLTRDSTCLIRVSGHVLASHEGISLDTNVTRRGSRRRVLELCIVRNAKLKRGDPSAISDDPMIQFVRDVRDETQKGSYRRVVAERVWEMVGTEQTAMFSDIRPLGYTRKMLKRHISRGDAIIR